MTPTSLTMSNSQEALGIEIGEREQGGPWHEDLELNGNESAKSSACERVLDRILQK